MLNKQTKIVAIVAGILLCVAITGVVYLVIRIGEYREGVTTEKELHAKMENREYELEALVRLVDETTEERAQFQSYVLSDEEVIEFLALVNQLGNEQGVMLETTKLTVAEEDDLFENLELTITATGNYAAVVHVLKLFEYLPYQSQVAGVSLSKGAVEDTWEAAFTLYVTKYKET